MISIEKTWENIDQPHDEESAGDIWFYVSTYRTIQKGLTLILEELDRNRELLEKLNVQSEVYESDLNRIKTMIQWGEERLQHKTRDFAEITVSGSSYKSLRYQKVGLLLLANKSLEERNSILSNYNRIPKSILQASDEKIQQILNLAEQGKMNGLKPHELFFELTNKPTPAQPSSDSNKTQPISTDTDIPIIDQVLRERCLHILRGLENENRQEQYDMIIREMSVILEDRIRDLSKIKTHISGSKLVTAAMKKEPLKIIFSSHNDYQDAAYLLFLGYTGFIRNEAMHHLVSSYTYERVIQLLGFVDYLLFLLSNADLKAQNDK